MAEWLSRHGHIGIVLTATQSTYNDDNNVSTGDGHGCGARAAQFDNNFKDL